MIELINKYSMEIPKDILDWLEKERGISRKIIDTFRIGWTGKAVAIPIYDEKNSYRRVTEKNPFHPSTTIIGGILQDDCAGLPGSASRQHHRHISQQSSF